MSAELDWDKMIICAKRAFTGDGLHRKCKMDGRVLTIELPAPERHWADCKAGLSWPCRDLRGVLECRPGSQGARASPIISVRSRTRQGEEGNQLLWYLNKIKDAFLKERCPRVEKKLKRLHHDF